VSTLSAAEQRVLVKAEADGSGEAQLAALHRRLQQLDEPGAGQVASDELEPIEDPVRLDALPEPSDAQAREALDQLVVLKLNGGLGTSMGLSGPKSLLPVKDGASFLDVIASSVLAVRTRYGARLPLVLMDSTTTRDPSLAALSRAGLTGVDDLPLDFLQGREPKLSADSHEPVSWPADPSLEWCPAGHGDLYSSLAATGMLERLLEAGLRYAFVSNADNLGAVADPRLAAFVVREQVPFLLEAVRGTAADRKGGHLARRDGQLVLRENAQVPDGDTSFTDVERWRFYNTNSVWVDLQALHALQQDDPAAPELPLIVNRKTVDPTDPRSPAVLQLETAMGAAVGSIRGARAVHVPRTRFAPVKTTDDLLVVRSDAYILDDGLMLPAVDGPLPVVTLDPHHYRLLDGFDARFPTGPPSLRECTSLRVEGDVRFGAGVVVRGDVVLRGPRDVADGEVLAG